MSDTPPRLLLDGDEREEIGPAPEGGRRALGHDPFEVEPEHDPFLERIDEIGVLLERAQASVLPPRAEAEPPPDPGRAEELHHPPGAHRVGLPRIGDLDPPAPAGLIERLLSDGERRRLAALEHLAPSEVAYDRFGFSPEVARTAFPFFLALYRYYFRVESRGHDRIPTEGPAILAANHAGVLPFDGAMGVLDVLLHTDPPRLPRAVVDRWAGSLPFVNVFFARVGQVIGTRENFADLLDEGQCLLVFPEGMDGVRKRITQRYRLQEFHTGFVEEALRARAPVVPMAIVGSDDQMPVLFDLEPIARRLGLPMLPITPTFPWLGPLGLLPYPVRYRIVYGEPLALHERFGPDAAEDVRLVRQLTQQVRRAIQQLVDRSR